MDSHHRWGPAACFYLGSNEEHHIITVSRNPGDMGIVHFHVNAKYRDNFIGVIQFGDAKWRSFKNSFRGTKTLLPSQGVPDLRYVEDMSGMFQDSGISYLPDAEKWDVSHVKNMSAMFKNAKNFNIGEAPLYQGSIANWDVSGVANMRNMFKGASKFSQNLKCWKVNNIVLASSFKPGWSAKATPPSKDRTSCNN